MAQQSMNLSKKELWNLSESCIEYTFADEGTKKEISRIFQESPLHPSK
jgi:hypothetical protein